MPTLSARCEPPRASPSQSVDWNTPPSLPYLPTPDTETHTSTHLRLNGPGSRWDRWQLRLPVERLVAMQMRTQDPEKEGAATPQIWTSCPDSNDFHLKLQRYKTLSGALEPFLPERWCQNHLLVHRRGTSNITAAVIETHIEIWRLHSLIACRILFLLRLHFLDRSEGLFSLSLSLFSALYFPGNVDGFC